MRGLLNSHETFPVPIDGRKSGTYLVQNEILLLVSFSTILLAVSGLEISMDLIIPARDNILGTYSPTFDVSGMVNPQFSSPQIPDSFLIGFRDYFEQSRDLPYPESDILLKCIPTTGSQGLEKAGYCLNNQTFYYVNSGGKLNVLDMKKYFDEECSQWEPSVENMGIQGCGIRYSSFSIRLQHTYLLVHFRKCYTEASKKTESLRVVWLTKSFNQIGAYLVELRPDLSQLPFRVFVTNLYPPMPDQRQSGVMIVYQSMEGHLQILQGNYPILQPRPAFCNPSEPGGFSQVSPALLDCGLTADLDCTFNQVYYYQQLQTMCVGICQINASNPSNLTINCRGSDGIWLGIPKDDNTTKGASRSVFRMSYAQEFTLMQFLFSREKIQVISLELGGLLNRKTQVETTTLIDGPYLKSLPPKYDLQQLDVVLLDSKLLFGAQIRSNDSIIAILQSRVTQAVFYTVQPHSTTSPGSTIVYGENILTFGTFPYLWVANQGEINYQIANNQKNETILRKVVVQSEFNKRRMFFTLKVKFHSSFFSCISLSESLSTSIYVNSSQMISIPEYSILGNDVNITNVTLLDGQQTPGYQVSILAQNTLQASLECESDTKPGEYRKCGRGSQGEFKYQDGFLLETYRAPSLAGDGTNSTYIRIFKCLTKQGEVKNFLGYLLLCIRFIDQSPPLPEGITTVGFYPQPKLSAFIILFSGIVSDEGSKSILMVMSKNISNTIVEEIKGTIFTHQFIAVRHLLPTSLSEEFSLMLIYSVFDDDKPVPKYKLFTKIYLVYAKSLKVKSLKEEKITEFGEKLEFFCPIGSFSGINSKIVYIISQCVLPNGSGTDTQLLETKQIGEKLSFVRSFKSLRLLSLTEPMKLCYINNLLITITSSFYRAFIEANLNYNIELPMYSRIKRVIKHFCFEKIGIFAVWLIDEFDQSVLYVYKTKYATSRMNSLYRVISVKGDYLEVFCIDKGLLIATRGVGNQISVSLLELDQIGIYAYADAAQGPRSLPIPVKFTYSISLGNRLGSKDLLIDIILDEDIGVTNLGKLEKTAYPNSTFGGLLPALNHKYLLNELFEVSGCLINAKLAPVILGDNCTDHFELDADTFKLRQSSVHRPDHENYLVENIRVEQQINYLQVDTIYQDSERYRLLVYNLSNGTLSSNPYNFLLDYGGQVPYLYVMDKERKGLLFWEGQEDNSFVLYVHIVNDLSTHNYSQLIQPANSEPIFDGPYDSF